LGDENVTWYVLWLRDWAGRFDLVAGLTATLLLQLPVVPKLFLANANYSY